MFTYQCLQCGKQHSNTGAFSEGYRATCLRCSHAFEVKREMARVAEDEASSGRSQAITTSPTARPDSIRGGIVAAPSPARDGIRQSPTPAGAAPSDGITRKRAKAPTPTPDDELDAMDAGDATEEELASLEREALPPEKKQKKPEDAPKKPADASAGRWKKPWVKWSAIGAPVVLVFAVIGIVVFGRSGKAKPPAAKNPAPKAKTVAKAAPPKPVEKKAEPRPVVREKPTIAFAVSAPRLAVEFASDPSNTDRKYQGTWVEVSGLFDKLETTKPAKGPPASVAVFLTEQGKVFCDLSEALAPEMAAWKALKHAAPCNVQGVYGKGAVLSKCVLAETRARADATFAGKTVELRGVVDAVLLPGPGVEFPTLALEVGTNSPLSLHCLFQKQDAQEMKFVRPGASVTLEGVCAGRRLEGGKHVLRIDNCRPVSTTGPSPTVPRMAPSDLAREFEEDLRPYYFPPPVRDPAAPALSVTQLSKEWKADGKSLGKYRSRIITVTGRLAKKAPGQLTLESAETDQPLAVSCRFGRAIRDRLADLTEYRVTGVCTGMEGARTLRLDDCGVDSSQLQYEGPRLTADFLPHTPGTTLTYDFLGFPTVGKKSPRINRQVWLQRAGGVTETIITHSAKFTGKSLFVPGKSPNWTASSTTSRTRLPGPVYVQKDSASAIEFGQRIVQPKGGTRVETKVVLKLGAKAGDSWEWLGESSKHTYTLVRFDDWKGRPSAVVKEVIHRPIIQGQEFEVEHVYARGLGEVERREWLKITSTEKTPIWESRLIDGYQGPSAPAARK